MAIVITPTIYKGGTGKSTSAVTIASGLGLMNKKVLLIDTDSQSDTTMELRLEDNIKNIYTPIVDVLMHNNPPNTLDYIQKTNLYFDFLGATKKLTMLEKILKEDLINDILVKILRPLQDKYDYIIIDTGKGDTQMSINVLVASNYIIIPFQTDKRALNTIDETLQDISKVKKHHNRRLEVLGLLPTQFSRRFISCNFVLDQAKKKYPDKVFVFCKLI